MSHRCLLTNTSFCDPAIRGLPAGSPDRGIRAARRVACRAFDLFKFQREIPPRRHSTSFSGSSFRPRDAKRKNPDNGRERGRGGGRGGRAVSVAQTPTIFPSCLSRVSAVRSPSPLPPTSAQLSRRGNRGEGETPLFLSSSLPCARARAGPDVT